MSANKSRALEETMSTPHTCGDGVHFEYYLKSSSQLPPLKTNELFVGNMIPFAMMRFALVREEEGAQHPNG